MAGAVPEEPAAWIFASENPRTPVRRDNLRARHMKRRLDTIGLQWATFQVLRRIHASLGHDAGIDPKVAADQRGHGIGVAIDVYTKAALSKRVEAAERLETPCLPLLPAFGPIQWSASSWHQANAEITSNTEHLVGKASDVQDSHHLCLPAALRSLDQLGDSAGMAVVRVLGEQRRGNIKVWLARLGALRQRGRW
jgi:hypothetical protein